MSGTTRTTTDAATIRSWAEARGGVPARVESSNDSLLRIMFPTDRQSNAAGLTVMEWTDFFDTFDREGLALVYQETTADGESSKFCRIVRR